MTFTDVADMIEEIGLPFSYYQFNDGTGVAPPFICFFYGGSNDLYADDSNYQKIETVYIELYSDQKDFTLEESVETVLKSHGLTWTREETWIDSERMYEVVFTMEVVITEENENNG